MFGPYLSTRLFSGSVGQSKVVRAIRCSSGGRREGAAKERGLRRPSLPSFPPWPGRGGGSLRPHRPGPFPCSFVRFCTCQEAAFVLSWGFRCFAPTQVSLLLYVFHPQTMFVSHSLVLGSGHRVLAHSRPRHVSYIYSMCEKKTMYCCRGRAMCPKAVSPFARWSTSCTVSILLTLGAGAVRWMMPPWEHLEWLPSKRLGSPGRGSCSPS